MRRERGSEPGPATSAALSAQSAAVLDAMLSSALNAVDLSSVNNPQRFAEFLLDCWRPQAMRVTELHSADSSTDAELRFSQILQQLRGGVMPFGVGEALRLARAADDLEALRDPVDRPRVSYDAAMHARAAATPTVHGRMLASIVRFARAKKVVEIGTAYGMGSLFLSSELGDDGRLITIEVSEPQRTNSRRILSALEPKRVTTLHAWSSEAVGEVAEKFGTIDLLFHDGGHSREAYIADFGHYEPLLAPGALVLFDNIRWNNPIWSVEDPKTYEGWLEVTRHPRVRAAVEIEDDYGLLQLR